MNGDSRNLVAWAPRPCLNHLRGKRMGEAPMPRWNVYAGALLTFFFAMPVHAASPEFIDSTISLSKKWIYKQQAEDNWEKPIDKHGDQKTGQTALAVYALLTAGESPQDPRIVKAVDYLRKTDT